MKSKNFSFKSTINSLKIQTKNTEPLLFTIYKTQILHFT